MFLCSMIQFLICDFNFDFDFDFIFDFIFGFGFDFDFGLISLPTSVQANAKTLAYLSLHLSIDATALTHLTLHAGNVAHCFEGLRLNIFS